MNKMKIIFVTEEDRIRHKLKFKSYYNEDLVSTDLIPRSANYGIATRDSFEADIIILLNKDRTGIHLKNRKGPCKDLTEEEIFELILQNA